MFSAFLFIPILLAHGYIAQWLERLTADQQVPGSNPGVPFFEGPADPPGNNKDTLVACADDAGGIAWHSEVFMT